MPKLTPTKPGTETSEVAALALVITLAIAASLMALAGAA